MIAFQIFLLLIFLIFSAFLSASEVSLFSLSSMKVKAFKTDPDPRKQLVSRLLASPRDLLVTIIMLNTIANILIQNVMSSMFGEDSSWLLNILFPLALMLVFGETIPKSIGMANNDQISYRVAPIVKAAQKIFLPIRVLLTAATGFISRVMFFFLKPEKEISHEELQHALKTSRRFGILNEDEAELVRGFLHLEDAQVKELMRPREEVLYYDVEEPLSKLIYLFVDKQCSRIPVCRGNLDNVMGVLTSLTVFVHRDELKTSLDLLPHLSKGFFVPEGVSAEMALRQMYDRQEPIALVVDEYGAVSGIISLEDLVERVIGEIADARDEKSRFTMSGEDVMIASGKFELAEFEKVFGVALPSPSNVVTLGGWLTELLGDIPRSGVKTEAYGFFFHVLAADPKRVRRVYVRRLKGEKE